MTDKHIGHGLDDIAYHVKWGFRREAFIWSPNAQTGINFHPIATELRQWLLRKGRFSVFAKEHMEEPYAHSNPYTYRASLLAAILADVINDSHAEATSTAPVDPMEADIRRVRIYNEQILYTARICEALIKQLLYCTQIGKKYYENAALGALLSTECRGCKSSGAKRHKLSLLGSLAHRYHLCLPFEHCLFEHLKIVTRRRNVEAAHSDVQVLQIRTAATSRQQLQADSVEAGEELVHMLQHISDLEQKMLGELGAMVFKARKPGKNVNRLSSPAV